MSTVSASPWAVTAPVVAKSLADIMSEERVANENAAVEQNVVDDFVYNEEDFMTEEELAAHRLAKGEAPVSNEDYVYNEDDFMTAEEKADRDFALALAAQEEEAVRREKKDPKYGNSKVNVCSSLDEHYKYGSSDGPSQNVQVSSDNFAAEELSAKLIGSAGCCGVSFKNGVANVDGTKVSKHDGLIDGMMNSIALGEMDGSGDMSGLMVSNKVSNGLKSFSKKQKQKGVYVGGRVSAKDTRSTSEAVLDENTRILLFKFIQKSLFDEVHGVIKTGKESNVYHATRLTNSPIIQDDDIISIEQESYENDTHEDKASTSSDDKGDEGSVSGSVASSLTHYIIENSDMNYKDVAVKVFKTTLNEFSNRIDYIKGDHRFSRQKYAKNSNNKRRFIAQWVEKEFRNLCRARAKGLNVPRPLVFKDNVLVMEMIVEDGVTSTIDALKNNTKFINSPQLKEVEALSQKKWENCYEQTIHLVRELYQKCRLVHADLSEYNLLLRNEEEVYALDFGQAIDTSHPEHKTYLLRDLDVVNAFFNKKGIKTRDSQELLDSIVNKNSSDDPLNPCTSMEENVFVDI